MLCQVMEGIQWSLCSYVGHDQSLKVVLAELHSSFPIGIIARTLGSAPFYGHGCAVYFSHSSFGHILSDRLETYSI